MTKQSSKNTAPPVHPELVELLRKVFSTDFPLNATDREVGRAKGYEEVIQYLDGLSNRFPTQTRTTPNG